MFGEMVIIEASARSATAAADVELAVVGRPTFRRLVAETPSSPRR